MHLYIVLQIKKEKPTEYKCAICNSQHQLNVHFIDQFHIQSFIDIVQCTNIVCNWCCGRFNLKCHKNNCYLMKMRKC